jgi:hypothetical protein
VVVGQDAGEGLGDAAQFQNGEGRITIWGHCRLLGAKRKT